MAIIKTGERRVRKGCPKCGEIQLYHGVDTEDMSNAMDIEGHFGTHVFVDRYGNKHDCGDVKSPEIVPDEIEEKVEEVKNDPKPEAFTGGITPEMLQAFELMSKVFGGKIDREEIRSMVREEFADVVFPTKVVVQRENGEVKPIEGLAHYQLDKVMKAVLADVYPMLVGGPGTGKSHMGKQIADALGLKFYTTSLTAQTPVSKFAGIVQADDFKMTGFYFAFKFGGLFALDEVDNGHPNTVAWLNAALANGWAEFANGEMVYRHKDFRFIVSANTYGHGGNRQFVGRNPIDGATLDRFVTITIEIDEALETHVAHSLGSADNAKQVLDFARKLRKNIAREGLQVICSPRGVFHGVKLLEAGWTFNEVVEGCFRKGLKDSDWNKVCA